MPERFSLTFEGYSQCLPGGSGNPVTTASAQTTTRATTTASRTTTGSTSGSTNVDAKFKGQGKLYFGVATDRNLLGGGSAGVIQRNFGQVWNLALFVIFM